MLILAIDTATDTLAVALADSGGVIAESTLIAGRRHLELLLPEIHRFLTTNGFEVKDVEAIITGVGPGTFSGLRVGIASARGLAQTLEVPLYASDTLHALALGMVQPGDAPDGMLIPVIDAKRSQVFSQPYRIEHDGGVIPVSPVVCTLPADLVESLGSAGSRFLAAGNGVLAYYDLFAGSPHMNTPSKDDVRHQVRARFHFAAAAESMKKPAPGLFEVVPMYVRDPDADKTILLRKREPWLK